MIKYFTGQELRWMDIQVILGCLPHLYKSFLHLTAGRDHQSYSLADIFNSSQISQPIIVRNSGLPLSDTPPGGRTDSSWAQRLLKSKIYGDEDTALTYCKGLALDLKQNLRMIFFLVLYSASSQSLLQLLTLSPTVAQVVKGVERRTALSHWL